ncbi:MAG: hypothetical protein R3F41_19410 [Gammaproteobacteria bacterium]|nr:hypothetical protein [Pseudomonadales bacterium]MCP5346377.1 hypothetical protein [Pseudomonadales bacterium]
MTRSPQLSDLQTDLLALDTARRGTLWWPGQALNSGVFHRPRNQLSI